MKGTVLNWEQLQQQDPKQTAVIVTYVKEDNPFWRRKRILIKGWASREEAWNWCQANDIRRWSKDSGAIIESFKLLRLSKVIRELAETKPKGVVAAIVA